jgi:hypothetical protein
MWHGIFIAIHAGTGVLALVTGLVAIRDGRLFDVYLLALATMTVSLALAVAAEWTAIGTTARVLFTAFAGLAAIMVWRGVLARRIRPAPHPSAAYVEHLGFTLVALLDGFVVIAVLNAGAPIWLVVAAGVTIAIAGHFGIRLARRALTQGQSREWSTS